jgi:alcohol dehydrogenase
MKSRPKRFAQFAQRIFGLPVEQNDLNCALEGIDRFERFLRSIGCSTRLSELKIGDQLLVRYAQDTLRIVSDGKGNLPGRPLMSEQDIVEVLRSAL